MNKLKVSLLILLCIGVGILMGGYLFSKSQPRSVFAIARCQSCLTLADLYGLMASIGIQKFPHLVPYVVFETEKTVVVKDPYDTKQLHYLIIPKKDIKNIGQISEADADYLVDMFLVARQIIEEERLFEYRILTNGPGFQDVTYLHFHLLANKE
jgi:hypothetical protein